MLRQFAINMRDGRVVLCTRETLANIDYYAITERVAYAIENGILDRQEVVAKITSSLRTDQVEWDKFINQKVTQNVRVSPISVETAERSETAISKDEVKREFDIPVEEAASAKVSRKKTAAKATTAEFDGEEVLQGL